jgi:ABC-2 type transport system ATP-binding protein
MLGPNGAGKTTTLRMLCGVLVPDSGSVTLDGIDMLTHGRVARARLGWLPDAAPAFDELRVEQWLTLRTRLYGVPAASVDIAIERCDIGSVRGRIIGHLSRGFRQRVALAAAIVHDPAVLVLDEPSTGLDPLQQRGFRRLIRELAQDRAVILSTHQVADAAAICDDLILLSGGSVRAAGDLGELQQAASRGRVALETKGDPTKLLNAIGAVDNVDTTVLEDGWHRTCITPIEASVDLRSTVAEAVAQAAMGWRELGPDHASLDALINQHLEEFNA